MPPSAPTATTCWTFGATRACRRGGGIDVTTSDATTGEPTTFRVPGDHVLDESADALVVDGLCGSNDAPADSVCVIDKNNPHEVYMFPETVPAPGFARGAVRVADATWVSNGRWLAIVTETIDLPPPLVDVQATLQRDGVKPAACAQTWLVRTPLRRVGCEYVITFRDVCAGRDRDVAIARDDTGEPRWHLAGAPCPPPAP
jgi:hypothetical protein